MKKVVLNFSDLVKDMQEAVKFLDSLPDDQEFTPADTDSIDEVRYVAMRLHDMAEAVIETFQGGGGS